MNDEETQLTEDDFDEIDREALNRALSIRLAENEGEGSDQIKYFLAESGWWYAASSACYQLQCHRLGLSPWQEPPCHGETGRSDANTLMRRLISYGLSQYEPDPVAAIAAKQKRKMTPMQENIASIRKLYGCSEKTARTLLATYAAGASWSAVEQWKILFEGALDDARN